MKWHTKSFLKDFVEYFCFLFCTSLECFEGYWYQGYGYYLNYEGEVPNEYNF